MRRSSRRRRPASRTKRGNMAAVIRFGISDGELRAATWKLWTPPNKLDVYLACRELRGTLKASLHASGKWHVAYSPTFFEENVSDNQSARKSRFVQQWSRPAPIIEGVTLAYRIVTPHASVRSSIARPSEKIKWIPNCPTGQGTEVDIFVMSNSPGISWPGKNSMQTQFLGSYKLPNGHSVCAVHRVTPLPDLSRALPPGPWKFFKGKTRDDLHGNLRAIAFGS